MTAQRAELGEICFQEGVVKSEQQGQYLEYNQWGGTSETTCVLTTIYAS